MLGPFVGQQDVYFFALQQDREGLIRMTVLRLHPALLRRLSRTLLRSMRICRYPQLASTVNFLSSLLGDLSENGETSPGGIPVDMQLQIASESNPDGSFNNSCLVEADAEYEACLPTQLDFISKHTRHT